MLREAERGACGRQLTADCPWAWFAGVVKQVESGPFSLHTQAKFCYSFQYLWKNRPSYNAKYPSVQRKHLY